MISWSGRRDSNPRRPAWEAGILPLNYSRALACRPRRLRATLILLPAPSQHQAPCHEQTRKRNQLSFLVTTNCLSLFAGPFPPNIFSFVPIVPCELRDSSPFVPSEPQVAAQRSPAWTWLDGPDASAAQSLFPAVPQLPCSSDHVRLLTAGRFLLLSLVNPITV
jgi:hypothetical protein